MDIKNDLTRLNNIHDLLEDSRKGYHEAAQRVEDPAIRALLNDLAASRRALITDVSSLRAETGPTVAPREGGTLKGDLHRAWMRVRDALSSGENADMLNECENGEKFLLMRYDEVLEKDGAPETFALTQRQRAVVEGNLQPIMELRKATQRVEH